jgi:hypothetical protein
MHHRRLLPLLTLGLALLSPAGLVPLAAQQPAAKAAPARSPADVAYDAYMAVRNAKDPAGPARNAAVLRAGTDYLIAHPAHWRAGSVISSVATFASSMPGPQNAAARAAYLAYANFELLGLKRREDISADAKLALAALDVALAGAQSRAERSRENVTAFREKIDALALMPKSDRFLSTAERDFGEFIRTGQRPDLAEQFYTQLLKHPDAKVVSMAEGELQLIGARKTPATLSFTALDGKPVDFPQLRGKVVLVTFWSPASKSSADAQVGLREIHRNYRKRGLEVVAVACAKEADRAAVEAWVKEKKLPWPQYFDGKEYANEIAQRFNVRSVPTAVLLNKDGLLVETGIPSSRFESVVKRALGIK